MPGIITLEDGSDHLDKRTKINSNFAAVKLELETATAAIANQWRGVPWAALGTSITSFGEYVAAVEELLGTTCTNLGVGGGCLSSSSSSGQSLIYNQIANIPVGTELVSIEAGINDFRLNSTLGTITSTNSNTFYGAYYNAIVAINALRPAAKIVLLTPYGNDDSDPRWNVPNSNSNTWQQFCDAVRETGKRMGVSVCDIATDSGINGLTADVYTSDGIHLNTLGGYVYGSSFNRFLKTLAKGPESPDLNTGFVLTNATISDISGFRTTPTAITSGVLTYTKLSDYGVLWFGSEIQNAMQFDCSSNPDMHIAVGYGDSGAIAFGPYLNSPTIAFRIDNTGNVTTSPIVPTSSRPGGNSATRFRVGVLNGAVRFEYWNGSIWTLDTAFTIAAQASMISDYRENVRVGVVVNSSSSVAFSSIKVGTYV